MYSIDYNDLAKDFFDDVSRKLTPRLELKSNVSPTKVEHLFKELLDFSNSGTLTIVEELSLKDRNVKLLNSLSFSFKFNTKKFNKYNYNTYIESMYPSNSLLLYRYEIIDYLNDEQINLIRELIIKMQNRRLFKNFSEYRAARIITNNFKSENNVGNSLSRNRQYFKNLLYRGTDNKSIYYEKDLNLIKPHFLRLYLPVYKG